MAISTIPSAGVSADTLTAADLAPNSVGASEIAAGAVSGNKIAYLGDGSGDLTGTVSSQQLHLADAFTLTGDLTVNDDLVLGKLRDDGTGQTLTHTAATNRTLTGTGTLTMGSSIEGEPKNRTNERATSFGDITAPSLVLTPSSAPSSPVKGAIYYNVAEDILRIYNGT